MALPLNDFHIGDIYKSRSHGDMEVISNENSRNVGVRFLNTGNTVYGLQRGNVKRGRVKDVFAPTIEGVGYLGTDRKVHHLPAYHCWKHMIVRCYSNNYHSTRGTYHDCSVDEPWKNFTIFEKWYEDNYIEGYHLDKDLLVQGNRKYSESTCCFIPPYLNSLIVEREGDSHGCQVGVTRRKKKGTDMYNGLYNVSYSGVYLHRTNSLDEANLLYKEFKELYFELLADKYEDLKLINPEQAECLRTRIIK